MGPGVGLAVGCGVCVAVPVGCGLGVAVAVTVSEILLPLLPQFEATIARPPRITSIGSAYGARRRRGTSNARVMSRTRLASHGIRGPAELCEPVPLIDPVVAPDVALVAPLSTSLAMAPGGTTIGGENKNRLLGAESPGAIRGELLPTVTVRIRPEKIAGELTSI